MIEIFIFNIVIKAFKIFTSDASQNKTVISGVDSFGHKLWLN